MPHLFWTSLCAQSSPFWSPAQPWTASVRLFSYGNKVALPHGILRPKQQMT